MIPVDEFAGRRVGVLGLGRTGLGAALALIEGGAEVIAWDDGEAARAAAERAGLALAPLTREMEGLSALIVSPGIPHLYPKPHPAVAAALAASVPVDNDIGLFFRALGRAAWAGYESPPRVVAVTGSNGKSTTCALIHHVLRSAGRPAQLGGNIGRAVLDMDPPVNGETLVIELSSYQLELARALTPDIGVFTNLAPDHLDRHGGMGGYFAAKRRLFAEGGPDHAVIGVDEPEGRFLAGQLSMGGADERVIRISASGKLSGPGWNVFARKGFLSEWRKGRQMASLDLRPFRALAGAHNHQNACAAWAALRALGLGPRQIGAGFESFEGLAHRGQLVAEIGGVSYVNDSKATNVASAARALDAHARIRWIAGGQAKAGDDPAALRDHLGNLTKAYLIGESGPRLAALLSEHPHELCHSLDAALARAAAEARPGDTVLLAPAAASFDQFRDFEHRGEVFIEGVRRLEAGPGQGPGPGQGG